MTVGTAMLIIAALYMLAGSHGLRMVALGTIAVALGGLAALMVYGADKPQTIFYSGADHPAFKMATGDTCPPERHIWNGWCVK